MQYLVDTNWVIDYMRGVSRVIERLDRLSQDGIGISIISLAELYQGVFYSRTPESDERELRHFLDNIRILDIDDQICRIFAMERGRLSSDGNIIGNFDILIAATAIHHNLTLLTNNRRHFERIQGLDIISV